MAGSLEMDAAYVDAIRRQIKDAGLAPRVSLLGALPARELAARCAASHLLAVPSSYEGFGIVYLEGMQFGLPAIAGSAGAAKEIITHGHNGFLVPPGNPEALAHHIALLDPGPGTLVEDEPGSASERRGSPHLERERRPCARLPPVIHGPSVRQLT